MSGDVTVNGYSVIAGRIIEPEEGPWRARIEIDLDEEEDEPLSDGDSVTIAFAEGTVFVGTVTRGSFEQGRWIGHVIAGAGGLRTDLDPKYFSNATVQLVATDILSSAGEALDSAGSDAGILATTLSRWQRNQGQARFALNELVRTNGGSWRVSRAGLVQIVAETVYAPATLDLVEIDRDPAAGTVLVAPEDDPVVTPGMSLDGEEVHTVETTWGPEGLRQTLTLNEESTKPRGVARQLAGAFRKSNEAAITASRHWPAKVIKQQSDGSVDLYPDHERVRGQGLASVPLRTGIPGVDVKIKPGERVAFHFEEGNPSKPAAALWPNGSGALELNFSVDTKLSFSTPAGKLEINADGSFSLEGPIGKVTSDAAGNVAIDGVGVKVGAAAVDQMVKGNTFVTLMDAMIAAAVAAAALISPPAGDGGTAAFTAFQIAWNAQKATILAQIGKVT